MSLNLSEYEIPQKSKYKKNRGFPLFRILILLLALSYAIHEGYFLKLYEYFFIPVQSKSVNHRSSSWNEICDSLQGKPFLLRDSVGQCSWKMMNSDSLFFDHDLWRYLIEVQSQGPIALHWVAPIENFGSPWFISLHEDSLERNFFRIPFKDSSFVWVDASSLCLFPGFCPKDPLEGGALPIPDDFDFQGRESLLMKDQFMGIGESPIYPILPGIILDISKDSLGSQMMMNHGDNLISRISGDFTAFSDLKKGSLIKANQAIARLAPKDSATFYLEVIRNGQFIRWNSFFNETHPISKEDIAKFRKQIGF